MIFVRKWGKITEFIIPEENQENVPSEGPVVAVTLAPEVGKNGELVLKSSGKKIGDPGFYFLLNDSKGRTWTQFIRTFKDQLTASPGAENINAVQKLTLWGLNVVKFSYQIFLKSVNNY